jgi:hypothetical protein
MIELLITLAEKSAPVRCNVPLDGFVKAIAPVVASVGARPPGAAEPATRKKL